MVRCSSVFGGPFDLSREDCEVWGRVLVSCRSRDLLRGDRFDDVPDFVRVGSSISIPRLGNVHMRW